ncbi:AsnC family transcriptional regulator [Sulfolobales archaeon HS-7]|nr:AsnC family transcriptional regulator [Sulfolobales archaeon HS-7]
MRTSKLKSELDETDKKLLMELLRDGRVTLRRLGETMNMSSAAIHNRLSRLVQLGVVKGYVPLLDYSKLGYNVTSVISAKIDGKHLIEFEKEIASNPNVVAVYDITGENDVLFIAKFRNIEELDGFIKQVLRNPSVERTSTSIVLNVVKEDPRLRIP